MHKSAPLSALICKNHKEITIDSTTINLGIVPNYELIAIILGLGEQEEGMEPGEMRGQLIGILEGALGLYS